MPTVKKSNRKELKTQISTHCLTCDVRDCSVLKYCKPATLDRISQAKKSAVYLKGQPILKEGLDDQGIYFIHSGHVKVYKSTRYGRQLILHFARSGEILGFNEADRNSSQPVSAKALNDTRLCYLDKGIFWSVIRENPDISLQLLKRFRGLLASSEEQSLKMARLHVPSKVADALCQMVEAFGTNPFQQLNLPLSRQDIADLAGTTKEQVSKTIAEFRMRKLIQTKGRQIAILDLPTLKEISNG